MPYPFGRLNNLLNNVNSKVLCRSLAGNKVSYIRLGNKGKPMIIIQARQHPG